MTVVFNLGSTTTAYAGSVALSCTTIVCNIVASRINVLKNFAIVPLITVTEIFTPRSRTRKEIPRNKK